MWSEVGARAFFSLSRFFFIIALFSHYRAFFALSRFFAVSRFFFSIIAIFCIITLSCIVALFRTIALSRSRVRSKKEPQDREKKRKCRTRKKKVQICVFPPFAAPHWKPGSIAQTAQQRKNKGLNKECECSCCFSMPLFMLHVLSEFLCFISMLCVHVARCPYLGPCFLSMLHNPAVFPCCMSLRQVPAANPFFMSALHLHMSMFHFHTCRMS